MVVEWWWWCKAIHFLDEIWTLSTPIFSISRTSSRQWPRNVKIKPRKNRSTSRSLLLAILFWACLFVQKRGTYQIPAWKFYPFFFYLPATWLMVSCRGTLDIFRAVLEWKRLDQFTFLKNYGKMRTRTPFKHVSVNIWTKLFVFQAAVRLVGFLPS